MKKSTIYRMAQMAVLTSIVLMDCDKLDILRELFDQEELALFCEERDAKENAE